MNLNYGSSKQMAIGSLIHKRVYGMLYGMLDQLEIPLNPTCVTFRIKLFYGLGLNTHYMATDQ